ncbi:hypothetical protein [Campylobacter insulaenigrae]|uniref:hypothetical protein n=1 Tax=Campylobacter insulaenigrae TaxID=260714 RepID=UPI00215358F9|nr:hypothetical protein [Campylobacter insulaenigrae]MCR6570947.1 hypothetical protein [Campylobacter insulaenigrae]MCR6582256.1 hypothetical protein [Campylobacter insulaenigrae]MCR6583019.1 hypothetical protein [Campylobacter insulaenigrae]
MSGTGLIFTECELIINQNRYPKLSDFDNKQRYIYDVDGKYCIIDCEIIQDNFFWIYIRYGKTKPYSDKVINTETKEVFLNKRDVKEAELRKQIFCMYDYKHATFYISNISQKKFLQEFLQKTFKYEFNIKNYYINPDEFVKEIISINEITFWADNNLFSGDIFNAVKDVLGEGEYGKFCFKLETGNNGIFDKKKILTFLNLMKNKKTNQEITKIKCVGKDDGGFEKIFNFETYLSKKPINALQDENAMYNPENVKNALLAKLND